jgi:hypothetical protein
MFYAFFWVIPLSLNSDAGELPRRKHKTYRTRQKFEIKNAMYVSVNNSSQVFKIASALYLGLATVMDTSHLITVVSADNKTVVATYGLLATG